MNRRLGWATLVAAAVLASGCATGSGKRAELPPATYAKGYTPAYLAEAGYHDGADFHTSRRLAPGVVQQYDSYSSGPLSVSAVTFDMNRDDLVLEAEKGQDGFTKRETIPAMMKRLDDPDARPLVGVNADFWGANSVPVGLFVDEGMIWRGPHRPEKNKIRSVFAFDDQRNFAIGLPEWSISLNGSGADEVFAIDDVNVPQPDSTSIAYTWPLGEKAPAPGEGETQIVLELDRAEWLPNAPSSATVVSVGEKGETPLTDKSVVVISKGSVPEWIKAGRSVELAAKLGNLPGKVIGVVGGSPLLLPDGKIVTRETASREAVGGSFVTDLHPRTAIGLTPDRKHVVIAVVDGRQPSRSVGINLPDLAEVMRGLGCDVAMNFDGGGSSSLGVRGELSNFPSDAGGPRSVTNALVWRRVAPIGPLARLEVIPGPSAVLPPGATVPLAANAFDKDFEPLSTQDIAFEWSATGGEIDSNGVLKVPQSAGAVRVTVTAPGGGGFAWWRRKPVTQTVTYSVLEPVSVRIAPEAMLLNPGESAPIGIEARADDGRAFWRDPGIWELDLPEFVTYDAATCALKANAKGKGHVVVRAGGKEARMAIAVGEDRESLAYSFDTLASAEMGKWIQAQNYSADATSITLDRERRQEGEASWRFKYAMAKGGTTKIALPIDATLPGTPLGVGFWVYGDGQAQWLRAELRDANNNGYYLDFTNADEGIAWKDEWRFVRTSFANAVPMAGSKGGMKPPLRIRTLYVAQAQEAAKRDGEINLDGLVAIDLPEGLRPTP